MQQDWTRRQNLSQEKLLQYSKNTPTKANVELLPEGVTEDWARFE